MKRAVLLVLIVTAVITIVFVWRDSRKGSVKVHDSFSQIEASLQEGLKRLRAASSAARVSKNVECDPDAAVSESLLYAAGGRVRSRAPRASAVRRSSGKLRRS